MPGHDIIILGASAGGVEALASIVRGLPADLPAAVLVVLHIPARGTSVLPAILQRAGALPAAHVVDGEPVRPGRIYVAPPDRHLVLRDGTVHLSAGPKENGARPALDPLMRTAARAYGRRVVGVVLSGNLDDGTAGLMAINARGGTTIVQDPDDALFTGMPRSAAENAAPDWILPAAAIADKLAELASTLVTEERTTMPDDANEIDMAEPSATPPQVEVTGVDPRDNPPSAFTCPECHGTLWEVRERDVLRFQCRVGHRYSTDTLVAEQEVALEAALWTALRSLEESAALAKRMADRASTRGHHATHARFVEQAADMAERARVVRQVLGTPGRMPGEHVRATAGAAGIGVGAHGGSASGSLT